MRLPLSLVLAVALLSACVKSPDSDVKTANPGGPSAPATAAKPGGVAKPSTEGDACEGSVRACSGDGHKVLLCKEGKFQAVLSCAAGFDCALAGDGSPACPSVPKSKTAGSPSAAPAPTAK